MFVALDISTEQPVVSLDARLADEELQARCRSETLVCSECRSTIYVRGLSGTQRRHFVHVSLRDCALQSEDAEIAAALPILYDWLSQKYPGCIRVQYRPPHVQGLPRPVDLCLVRDEAPPVAFWFFSSTGAPPAARVALEKSFKSAGVNAIWIFTGELQDSESELDGEPAAEGSLTSEPAAEPTVGAASWPCGDIDLRPMHRHFLRVTQYDQPEPGCLGSIHFLDPKTGILTTYRRLWLVHKPQRHCGDVLSTPVSSLLIDHIGEMCHPGEDDWLTRRSMAGGSRRWSMQPSLVEPLARCRKCGAMKVGRAQPIYIGKTNECICRDCSPR